MAIYCDESGGIATGAMTLAAVAIGEADADRLLARYRAITGLTGELKGSRIDIAERGLVFELLDRFGGRAVVIEALAKAMPAEDAASHPPRGRDARVYAALLGQAVGALLVEEEETQAVFIDDGRYDPATTEAMRAAVGAMLAGRSGSARAVASLFDSHRSAGIQIADVVANSALHLALGDARSTRIAAILDPFLANGRIAIRPLSFPG